MISYMFEESCKICGGKHRTGFCTTSEGKEMKEERIIKDAQEKVSTLLGQYGIVSTQEQKQLSSECLNEFLVRSSHEFVNLPTEISDQTKKKIRRMLGLGETGARELSSEERDKQIEMLIMEMRGYLEKLRVHQDDILGMILCGSRMDNQKMPAEESDVDVVFIFKSGFHLDPSTPEGEKLLYHLRDYTDKTASDSGFPVEIDELYGEDIFFKKMTQADSEMLIWGWNADAVRYIGEPLGELNESSVNEYIQQTLTNNVFKEKRQNRIKEAAQKLLNT
ncbi:MAG: hypothetical protein UT30_C0001G0060 [Candidatus Uhrbacteria bacterium GW2011_GWF2_39_13]|uniref:Uncharacterized protein n=1 Tax=Candidatus Uhrbacteria bacterium GW2011_GWF2_39_13 TaxID=1618995 RepID=A0A0G0MXB7_9BACT|nr:MAG: hypothetical protein UT30_C0001G0060 [Candidatus Uhrbacteria bacterium GW2011_GWF2_39_13]HAU66386.1 hypothetical protein [Candidatus Uhrbacteria bacterium]